MDCFRAENLQCIKQDRELFAQLDLKVSQGEALHVTGENGSGKTSLLRILAGLSQAQEGQIYWNDAPVDKNREEFNKRLLYLGHKLALSSALSAVENLMFWAGIHCTNRTVESSQSDYSQFDYYKILGELGLAGLEDMPVAHLSAGQQRRVSLSRIWLKPSRLMILDEPFNALDKQSRAVLEGKLKQHIDAGGMLILTSHWQLPQVFDAKELFLEFNI